MLWSQEGRIRLPEDGDGDKVTREKAHSPRLQRWLCAVFCASLLVGSLATFAFLPAGNRHDDKHGRLSDAEAETLFLSLPSNDTIRDWLKYYTSVAHIAGS